jgi:hypothetical protein
MSWPQTKPGWARVAASLVALMGLLGGLVCGQAQAQTAQKPSFYRARHQPGDTGPQRPADPAHYLSTLSSRAEFDRLARVYDAGSAFELPHLLFVIDRGDHDRVYYVNTRRYELHERFVAAQHLVADASRAKLASNYRLPDRRFLFGTLSWQSTLGRWTCEFWEGDQLTATLLTLAHARLQESFFAPLVFKTNSTQHLDVAQAAKLEVVTQEQLVGEQNFLPLNMGTAQGRLRLIESVDTAQDIEPDDIVVLREVPIGLPPVAGVVTIRASTVLSHVNLLAKGWGIPNVYVRDAFEALAALDGQWVELRVTRSGYTVRPTTKLPRAHPQPSAPSSLVALPTLTRQGLMPLSALRTKDRVHCGSKAANLGEVSASLSARRLPGVAPVPDGFCIPFAQYAEFIHAEAATRRITRAEQTPGFEHDAAVRRQALEALRHDLAELPFDTPHAAAWQAQWLAQWRSRLAQGGVFVRSSSNSEDLPGFSGAGLYSTVPNVKDEAALVRAVQTVWASVFNFEAYEARRQSHIPHDRVVMGVLVQRAVDAQAAGVMVTRDPFDATQRDVTMITAKHGLGIKVVEGPRVAEQVLYNRRDKAVQLLTHSAEDQALQLDELGGVKEVLVDRTRPVLSDALVRRLAQVGERCKRALGGRDQDIEWATNRRGDIVVLQSRPFVSR